MNDAYDSMQKRLDGIRDAVTNVANGYFTGVYLCGPRGTSKTWTVEETLKILGRQGKYDPHNGGGITDGGLLELLWQNDANHLDRNLLLDDCGELFTPKCARARQYLLKALGGKGGTTRYIPYVSAKEERTVEFRRGIFAISNIPLARHNDNVLGALRDRVIVLNHEPTDVELVALMRHHAQEPIDGVLPEQLVEIVDYLESLYASHDLRPSLRDFFLKAIPVYRACKAGDSRHPWQARLKADITMRTILPDCPTRADQVAYKQRVAVAISKQHKHLKDRLRAWEEATGDGQASLYRHLRNARIK